MLTPKEKSSLPEKKNLPRGRSNPQRCIKQDSEPNTLYRLSYSAPTVHARTHHNRQYMIITPTPQLNDTLTKGEEEERKKETVGSAAFSFSFFFLCRSGVGNGIVTIL